MQLEVQSSRSASAHEVFADGLANLERQRADCDRIPNLEQDGFCPVGQPRKFGIGVDDGHQRVARWDESPFLGSANLERQLAAMLLQQTEPASIVENFVGAEVQRGQEAGFFDVSLGEHDARVVRLQDSLKTLKQCVLPEAAA